MTDLSKLVEGIEEKMQLLIEQNNSLRNECKLMKQENQDLIRLLDTKTKYINQLESQLETLTVAGTFEAELGKDKGKEKIQSLIREIDRSIGLLKKN